MKPSENTIIEFIILPNEIGQYLELRCSHFNMRRRYLRLNDTLHLIRLQLNLACPFRRRRHFCMWHSRIRLVGIHFCHIFLWKIAKCQMVPAGTPSHIYVGCRVY